MDNSVFHQGETSPFPGASYPPSSAAFHNMTPLCFVEVLVLAASAVVDAVPWHVGLVLQDVCAYLAADTTVASYVEDTCQGVAAFA